MGRLKLNPMPKKVDGTAYSAMDLREIQDRIVRPQLQRVAGVAEVNSIGGFNKTYVVAHRLKPYATVEYFLKPTTNCFTGK